MGGNASGAGALSAVCVLPRDPHGPILEEKTEAQRVTARGPLVAPRSCCAWRERDWRDRQRGCDWALPRGVLSLTRSIPQMGRPLGEKVSDTQLSATPAAPRHAPGDAIPGPEDSDLLPSVTLAAALALLFLLLSAWLVWDRPLQAPC